MKGHLASTQHIQWLCRQMCCGSEGANKTPKPGQKPPGSVEGYRVGVLNIEHKREQAEERGKT